MMIAPLSLGALLLSSAFASALPTGLDARSPLPPLTSSDLVPRHLLPRDTNQISRCAIHVTPERHRRYEAHFKTHRKAAPKNGRLAMEPINVNFHVVYANETEPGGYVQDDQLNKQVDALNKAYSSTTPMTFKLANITRTHNEDWFLKAGPDEAQQGAMKQKLRTGAAKDLNVFLVGFKQGSGKGLLGYATFPADFEGKPEDDGVVIQYATLPGGTMPNYNLGVTLIHEAGHWAGLYHTFQGGCEEPGDYIDDTAPEASAASGCPAKRQTCGTATFDPVTNYMDYTYDSCMTGFTEGQGQRIGDQMRTYRGTN